MTKQHPLTFFWHGHIWPECDFEEGKKERTWLVPVQVTSSVASSSRCLPFTHGTTHTFKETGILHSQDVARDPEEEPLQNSISLLIFISERIARWPQLQVSNRFFSFTTFERCGMSLTFLYSQMSIFYEFRKEIDIHPNI